jgi:hypothetical protein
MGTLGFQQTLFNQEKKILIDMRRLREKRQVSSTLACSSSAGVSLAYSSVFGSQS